MEYIHSLSDGRKAVIYDEGNNVMLLFITNIRNMQSAVIARDYLSLLDCLYFRNNLYISYISTGNELKWKQAGRDDGLVLISGTGEAFDVAGISQFVINEKIYVSYQIYNGSINSYEIRYIAPNGDRKSKTIFSQDEKIKGYRMEKINEDVYLIIQLKENGPYDYYRLDIDGQEDISLSREYLVDEKEENKRKEDFEKKVKLFEDEKNKYKDNMEKEFESEKKRENEQFKLEIEKLKEELQKQHSDEIKALEENYTRQYNELSDMTRQVQEEGRRYRDLYVQTLEVVNRKKENDKSSDETVDKEIKKSSDGKKSINGKKEKTETNIAETNKTKKNTDETNKTETGKAGTNKAEINKNKTGKAGTNKAEINKNETKVSENTVTKTTRKKKTTAKSKPDNKSDNITENPKDKVAKNES